MNPWRYRMIASGVAKPKTVGTAMPPIGGTSLKPDELKAVEVSPGFFCPHRG